MTTATLASMLALLVAAFAAVLSANAANAQSLEPPLELQLDAYKDSFELQPLTVDISWSYPADKLAGVTFEVERGFFAFGRSPSAVQFSPLVNAEVVQDGTHHFTVTDVDAWDIGEGTPCYRVRAVSGDVRSEYVTDCFMEAPGTGAEGPTPIVPPAGSGLRTYGEAQPFAGDRALLSILFGGSTLGLLGAFLFVRKVRATAGR